MVNGRIKRAKAQEWDDRPCSITVKLAPLSLCILQFIPYTKEELDQIKEKEWEAVKARERAEKAKAKEAQRIKAKLEKVKAQELEKARERARKAKEREAQRESEAKAAERNGKPKKAEAVTEGTRKPGQVRETKKTRRE